MKVPLISRAKHKYRGRQLAPNDPFEAETEQDAEDLIAIHFAEKPKEGDRTLHVRREYKRRDMKVEE